MKKLLFSLIVLAGIQLCPAPSVVVPKSGTDSNTVYSIALQAAYNVGGATGGVTIATANMLAATNSAYQRTNGTSSFVGNGTGLTNVLNLSDAATNKSGYKVLVNQSPYTTNLHLGSDYFVEAFGDGATNALDSDGIGAWTYNRYNNSGSLIGRYWHSIDLQFARYQEEQTALPGNAILWGVGNVAGWYTAGGANVPPQDNAVIVNGTMNTNMGVESTILSGTWNTIWAWNQDAPAHSVILNGIFGRAAGDYCTILGGSNVIASGFGNVYGGDHVQRTNNWEFYWGQKKYLTNSIVVAGAGNSGANGTYLVADVRFYTNSGNAYVLTNFAANQWHIKSNTTILYSNAIPAGTIETPTSWTIASGAAAAPTSYFNTYVNSGFSVLPTNGTITAEGNMRFKVGDSTSWTDIGITGFTNQNSDGSLVSLGATNSTAGAPQLTMLAAGGAYDSSFTAVGASWNFLGTPLVSINGETGEATFTGVTSGAYSGSGAGLTDISAQKLNIGSNSVSVTPNVTIYLTNNNGTVFRLSAQKL